MRPTVDAAFAHHSAGRIAEAEAGYRQVLMVEPDNADALYLLGALNLQRGDAAAALPLLERAVRRQGRNPHIRASLGTALLELNRTEEAIREFRRVLDIDPRHADALYNLGNALAGLERMGEARPYYERVLALHPDHPGVLNNLALCFINAREHDRAIDLLRRAVAAAPDYQSARNNLGLTLHVVGRNDEALEVLTEATRRQPGDPMAHALLGDVLERADRLDEAEAHCRAALQIAPDLVEGLLNLGNVERRRGRFEEAVALCRRALAQRPDYGAALDNLGNALTQLGRYDEAEEAFEGVIALDPHNADAFANCAHMLKAVGRLDEAIARADAALAIAPGHADARMVRALCCLLLGRWHEGFRDYRARESTDAIAHRVHREPLPADLSGRHVWIVRDQGLGDELFFLRFAAQPRERGARTTSAGDPRLAAMVARSGAVDAVAPPEAAPRADFVVAVGDLPWLVGMADGEAPPPSIAVAPLPERVAAMRARLEALGPRPWLALTWRAGTPGRDRTLFKEVGLDRLAVALRPTAATLLAIQRRPAPGEVAALAATAGRPVHDLTALNDDLEDMLALVGLADRYVTVSNTNVHLRAAAGLASHVLVPNPPEFRWMAAGAESPWFPGCRLYRQRADGDWDSAIAALRVDLGHD